MAEKSDPTKDPEFQKVVQRMLRTPPKPRKQHKEKQRKAASIRKHKDS